MDSKIGTSDDKGNAATTCHMLPCNIDYEGMATTHLHFKPAELEDGILASTFRGRGLLAAARQKNDGGDDNNDVVTVKAHLLSLEGDQIILKASINNLVEWHHEHNPETIKLFHTENSRLQTANDWCEIANALHEPLPLELEDKDTSKTK